MEKPPKKAPERQPDPRKLKVIKRVAQDIAKGRKPSVSKIMVEEGYAPATAEHPSKITKSKEYKQILADAGLGDKELAAGHRVLAEASHLRTHEFLFHSKKTKKKNGKVKHTYVPISDKDIMAVISRISGSAFIRIEAYETKKIAYFTVPDTQARKGAIELGYKVAGHFAPEKQEHTFPELSDEEKDQLDEIFDSNKSNAK